MILSRAQIAQIFAQAKAIIPDDHFVYAKKETGWFHGRAYVNKDAIYPDTSAVSQLCHCLAHTFFTANIEIDAVVAPTVGGVALSQWTTHWLNDFIAISSGDDYTYAKKVDAVFADEIDVLEEKEFPSEIPDEIPKSPPIILEFAAYGGVRIEASAFNGLLAIKKIRYTAKTGTQRVLKRGYDKYAAGGKKCLIVEDIINSGATVVKTIKAVENAGGEVVGVGALCNRSGGKVSVVTFGVPRLVSLLDLDMEMFPEDTCPICAERGPESVRTDLGKGLEFLARKGITLKQ